MGVMPENGGNSGKNGVITTKMAVIRLHQASHDFGVGQNCSPTLAPITHTASLHCTVHTHF